MKRQTGSAARERILREAEHLIHMQGFHCTSLDDIAGCCKTTKANLLHHFRSKEALGLAVLDFKIAATRCGCLDSCFKAEADPVEAVRELFDSARRFYSKNGCRAGCFVGNMALEMSDINERFRQKVGLFFQEWVGRIEKSFACKQSQGLLRRDTDPRALAESILALYEGSIMLARTMRDSGVFRRTGAIAEALVLANLSGRSKEMTATHGR